MSIKALNLVFDNGPDDRAQYMVLIALADWSNDDGVSWPAVGTLAKKSRCSVRTCQYTLDKLSNPKLWGGTEPLVKIFPGQGPSGVNKYQINMKMLAAGRPAQSDESEDVAASPENARVQELHPPQKLHPAVSDVEVVQTRRRNCTQTIIEPLEEPLSVPARACEADADLSEPNQAAPEDGSKARRSMIIRAFRSFINNWPGFAGMSPAGAERIWFTLSDQDRAAAASRKEAWISLLRKQGKTHTPAPSTYLRERLWEAVEPQADPGERTLAAPFGKAWMVHLLRLLDKPPAVPPPASAFMAKEIAAGTEKGKQWALDRQAAYGWPAVNFAFERAQEGKGVLLPAGSDDVPGMEAVDVTQARFEDWRCAFERRGWPWLTVPPRVEFVWFPKGGPAAYFAEEISALEGAIA